MRRKSTFMYAFGSLLLVVVLVLITIVALILNKTDVVHDINVLILLLPLIIVIPAYIVIVGRLVYRDAVKRGLDPWLWATVAVFVPNLIGVIIYLIVRQWGQNTCINCSKPIQKDFKLCPYCGKKQENICDNCKKTVARDWSVCPYCAHPLSGEKGRE